MKDASMTAPPLNNRTLIGTSSGAPHSQRTRASETVANTLVYKVACQ